MANLILTNCEFLVPPDRVCWGTEIKQEQGLCEDCSIYAERKKSHFLLEKPSPINHKYARVVQHAFAVTVEAIT
jgi:hypothetical protein